MISIQFTKKNCGVENGILTKSYILLFFSILVYHDITLRHTIDWVGLQIQVQKFIGYLVLNKVFKSKVENIQLSILMNNQNNFNEFNFNCLFIYQKKKKKKNHTLHFHPVSVLND